MTLVKICGLSTSETMQAALDARADMVGLNFFKRSPRYVNVEQAARLADQARGRSKIVALVVDEDDDTITSMARLVKPDLIQVHGSETPERVQEIAGATSLPVIKAIKVRTAADIASARDFARVAAMILYDAKAPETLAGALPGGNGLSFDWALLQGTEQSAFMLSGGLTPENVAQAIALTKAPIVDVSSGVEIAPGAKDKTLIRKFIEAAKAAR